MYNDDHDDRSNLTKMVIMALITATFVISLISFSCNAKAQTFGNNNNPSPTLLTELFTKVKQSVDTVNIATIPDSFNIITNVVPSTTTDQGPSAKAGIQGGDLFPDIKGSYIEVSRIINIPRNIPNSSSIPSSSNQTSTNIPSSSNQTSTNIPSSSNQTSTNIPSSSNQTSDILTYQNSSYGISIQYPANWTKDEQDYDPHDNITNIVAFNSPLTNRFDNYSETLAISMEKLSNQNMTLKEYATSLITDYNKTFTDFKVIELNTNITLAGANNNPAYGLIYTDRENGTNYKTMEIGTIIGERIYAIEYFSEEKQYSNYLPTIQMMINSLQIT